MARWNLGFTLVAPKRRKPWRLHYIDNPGRPLWKCSPRVTQQPTVAARYFDRVRPLCGKFSLKSLEKFQQTSNAANAPSEDKLLC